MIPLIANTFTFASSQETNNIAYLQSVNGSNYLTEYPRDTNPVTGKWQDFQTVTSVSWIAGFFPGSLWMMYEHTGDTTWLTQAKAFTAGIAAIQNDPIDSDLGFRTVPSFYQGWLLSNNENDPGGAYRAQAASVLVNTANSLATRFDMGGWPVGAIKSWGTGNYPVYVDDLVNNTLFFAAWDVSGRPKSGAAYTLYQDAITTANTTLANNVRANGSIYHIVDFNSSGQVTDKDSSPYPLDYQGYAPESTWSRGQAWAMYGFTEAYRYTQNDPSANPAHFLAAAQLTSDYFISHLPANYTADIYNYTPGDFVPPSDFNASLGEPVGPYNDYKGVAGVPAPGTNAPTLRDASAAAVAASALLELSTLETDPTEQQKYFTAGENILRCLMTFRDASGNLVYLTQGTNQMALLMNEEGSWSDNQETSFIWGDYYFLEALQRYDNIVLPVNFYWNGAASNNWTTSPADVDWSGSSPWSNKANRATPNTVTFDLTTPAAVNVNSNIDVGSITFITAGWTLNAGTGVLAFGGTGAFNVTTTTGTDTINAAITDGSTFGTGGGVTSLVKLGPGILVLGGANSYSGGTTVSAGTLTIAAAGALPGATVVVNNAAFMVNANSIASQITGSGATTVGAAAKLTVNSILQNSLTINGTLAVAATPLLAGPGNRNPSATTSVVGALAIVGGTTPTGTLNLNNNILIISNGGTAALGTVEAQIAYARHGGAWDKSGITSTSAQTAHAATGFDSLTLGDILNSSLATPYTTFGGQPVNPNDVLIEFTYGGDANLNGIVNGDDYFRIDQGFTNHLTGWINGDFNHDGVVNGDDYFIIDSNFINQSGQLAASEVQAHESMFGPSYLSGFTGAQLTAIGVPEPGSLLLAGLGAIGLCARTRGRRSVARPSVDD